MKILFLNSPWINTDSEYGVKAGTRWASLRKKDQSMPYFPFPYYLSSSAALLRREGFDAHVKDAVAEELSREECLAYVAREKPAMLVVEAFTPSIFEDLSFMKAVKEITGCVTVFCGPHPTALAREMLENDFMDFVLLGEYDYTARDLAAALRDKRLSYGMIEGLAYKEKGAIKINARRPPLQNLDELPVPARDELPLHKYNEPFSKFYPNAKIVTSRGCPHNCIFCTEPLMYGGSSYKKRSVKLILEEIKILRDIYKVREVFFDDSIFPVARAREIAEGILASSLKIAWSCWIDWNIGMDDLRLMRRSGCIGVKVGVESANLDILKKAQKPVNIEKIRDLVRNCRRSGLLCSGAFMFGLPGDTPETMRKTIDLAFSLGLTTCQLSIATPLPGTPFFRMAEESGWLLTRDWRMYNCHYTSVVAYPGCGKEAIEQAIGTAREKKVKQILENPLVAFGYMVKLYRRNGLRGMIRDIRKKSSFVLKAFGSRK
jgi:anaerobic magnesium-protoporphyrin IX monomethyl ester cyclase